MDERVFVWQISIALHGNQQDRMIGDARPCRMMACSSRCKCVRWSRREPFTRKILLWKQQQVGLWLICSFIYNRLVKGGQHLKHDRPTATYVFNVWGRGTVAWAGRVSKESRRAMWRRSSSHHQISMDEYVTQMLMDADRQAAEDAHSRRLPSAINIYTRQHNDTCYMGLGNILAHIYLNHWAEGIERNDINTQYLDFKLIFKPLRKLC